MAITCPFCGSELTVFANEKNFLLVEDTVCECGAYGIVIDEEDLYMVPYLVEEFYSLPSESHERYTIENILIDEFYDESLPKRMQIPHRVYLSIAKLNTEKYAEEM